jgi:LuxR family maltose regulon positive regulatory protein
MRDQNLTLLQTKLHQPHIPRDLVERTRLVESLERGIEAPLTLVCAPAGYGKTTLVCTWLGRTVAGAGRDSSSLPSAWLLLDEDDSDLGKFMRYFIAALRTIFDGACPGTLALLQSPQQPPQEVLYTSLCNELEELPRESILVLDDYHFIRGKAVHNLLIKLARHWPKPLHLVLISRIDPPLPLASLRAKGMIREIRTEDLRLTSQESAAYLSQVQFASLDKATLQLLQGRFEGWIAGLHLAVLSLRSTSNQESVLALLSSENPNITGYLVDEVLTGQIPAIQAFLLKTSILNRFCASLCEAILKPVDRAWSVRDCLDRIERAELFITSLDNRRQWYRYHHLFQELLQRRLAAETAAEQVSELHRRASAWFEEHGSIDEALHHALAAGDLDLAARQMSAGLRDALNQEGRPTLERWLRLLPEEMVQRHPGLLMIKVWVLQFTWRLDLQAQVLQQIEEMLDSEAGAAVPEDERQLLRGQILLIKAQRAYFSNQPTRAIDLCRQALALLPLSWTFGRGAAMLFLGFSMQATGQAQAAERLLLDEYDSYGDKADAYALLVLESLCFIYLHTGQLEQTRRVALLLRQGATRSGNAFMRNLGDWYLGSLCYYLNELEAAAQHFAQIVENRFTAQVTAYRDAVAGLVLIHQIRGESSEAWRMAESISQHDLEQRGAEEARTRSLRARLSLLQGDLDGASRWADTLTDPPPDQPLVWLEEPQVTRVRILVARGKDADRRLALQLIDSLAEIAVRTHNTPYQIELLALRALALDGQGENIHADAALMQALELARPGGFIRVFVDLGHPMQAMLRRLVRQGHSMGMINRILSAYPISDKNQPGTEGAVKQPFAGNSALAEPLTPRELEVLLLLRGPLSLKEIALKLNITYATVKSHTINIYSKLGVQGRWGAVARAEELSILPAR